MPKVFNLLFSFMILVLLGLSLFFILAEARLELLECCDEPLIRLWNLLQISGEIVDDGLFVAGFDALALKSTYDPGVAFGFLPSLVCKLSAWPA